MGAFDQQAAVDLDSGGTLDWLHDYQQAARAGWLASRMPTRKTEAWKYTSIAALGEHDYLHFPRPAQMRWTVKDHQIDGLDADRLVFVNGCFQTELSSITTSAGIALFSQANTLQRGLIKQHLGSIESSKDNPFMALNGAWLQDGVLLHVGPGEQRTKPLHVVHLNLPWERSFCISQRLLVVLEPNASANLIEHFLSHGADQNSFATGTTEVHIAGNSRLNHYRLHLEEEHSAHIGGVYARLLDDARYDAFVLALGSRLKRLDIHVHHQGRGSECRLNGIYLSKGQQHVDLHTTMEHEAAHGTSHEIVRGIVDDSARAVFNGRIHIHPEAQKTSADLSNANLLLSNSAEIDTKPELEIYADDVRCSHGATVSRIDEKGLYYLQSRGIPRREAEIMLAFGFINELILAIPIEALSRLLRRTLTGWFDAEARMTRHLL